MSEIDAETGGGAKDASTGTASGGAKDASTTTAGGRGEVAVTEPQGAQRALIRRSAEARATVPDLDLWAEVDMSAALALRGRDGASLTAILVRACAVAAAESGRANGAYRDGRFERYSRVNVGVVIAVEDQLVVPTVFDADRKSLAELAAELAALGQGARAHTLTGSALSGATISLWNAGALGVQAATPLVLAGQAAAVCAGEIRQVPVVRQGNVTAASVLTLTVACDHRILFGNEAARFSRRLRAELEST
jgi:pyruvate dehydrogenase E2 component (dihydrolipoamide acetyltransferase)